VIERPEFRELEKKADATETHVVRLQEQVKTLQDAIKQCVTIAEFAPVKLIAYGLATLALSSVVLAIIAKVVVK
jgi:hypothetical protein